MASMLMKKMTKTVSMNPRKKTGYARAPIANDETTMFADSHCRQVSAFCQTSSPKSFWIKTYQCANFRHARIGTLVTGHTLDASRLHAKSVGEPLCLRIPAVSHDEGLSGNSAIIGDVVAAIAGLFPGLDLHVRLVVGERTHGEDGLVVFGASRLGAADHEDEVREG